MHREKVYSQCLSQSHVHNVGNTLISDVLYVDVFVGVGKPPFSSCDIPFLSPPFSLPYSRKPLPKTPTSIFSISTDRPHQRRPTIDLIGDPRPRKSPFFHRPRIHCFKRPQIDVSDSDTQPFLPEIHDHEKVSFLLADDLPYFKFSFSSTSSYVQVFSPFTSPFETTFTSFYIHKRWFIELIITIVV